MKFLSYESKFSQAMLKITRACYLNLLWFLCSVPIFTFGASTTALYHVTLKISRDEDPDVTREFFRGFKNNFKQSTVIWLIMLAAGVLLGADGYILYRLHNSKAGVFGIIVTLMFALVIAASIAYVIIFLYIFPLTASVINTNKAMFINSFLIGIRYLFCTILLFALHFAMFFAVVAFFTPLIVFGEGIVALLCSYLLKNVISICSINPDDENSDANPTADKTESISS